MRTIKNYNGTRELTKEQDDAITALLEGNDVAPDTLSARDKTTIGFCYHSGSYLEQDYERAIYWFKLAAKERWADAERNLAICYGKGLGVERNFDLSMYWYKRAANHGNAEAMCSIAEMYYEGLGLRQSIKKAWYWMDKAIERAFETEDAVLLCWLGNQFYQGEGMFEKDLGKAEKCYRKAAELDFPFAKQFLSMMIQKGEVKTD
jgi:hypothetical protein